jgi:PAS domain S-box-containing protein
MSLQSQFHELSIESLRPGSIEEAHVLLEELRIHQAELEQQTQALIESQRVAEHQASLYRHLLSEVPVALCRIDARGHISGANKAMERLLGRPATLLDGLMLYRQGLDDKQRVQLLQATQMAVSRERHEANQIWLHTSEAQVLVDVHFSRLPESLDHAREWIVALVDQTRHQQEHMALQGAHEALLHANQTNQELALLADRSPSAVLVCDRDFRIRWVNPSFTRTTGYTLAEAKGQRPDVLLDGLGADEHQPLPEGFRLDGGLPIDRLCLSHQTRQGQRYWAEVSVLPIRHEDGQITSYIVTEQDISDRIKAESERLVLMRVEADHAAKAEFLSRMSHNMRTPLNAVIGFSQLLMKDKELVTSPAQQQKLGIVHQAGHQLLTLVDQALQLAQLDHEMKSPELQCVNLALIVADCLSMTQERAQAKGLTLIDDVQAPMALGDPQLIREILDNLLSNAIKYTNEPGNIWVKVEPAPPGQLVQIQVQDHGVGIAPDDLDTIFMPFTRLEATSHMAPGHGIGLAISRRLAQRMHGTLTVNSTSNEGSIFTLSLPIPQASTPVPVPPTLAPEPLVQLPPMRLLCVEDHPLNRLLIEAVFSHAPQVQVVMATNLTQGTELALLGQPHVILLDINLPDGSGLALCRRLRATPYLVQQPLVIALSADALPENISEAMDAGVDHYLVKPLQVDRLFEILSQVTTST